MLTLKSPTRISLEVKEGPAERRRSDRDRRSVEEEGG